MFGSRQSERKPDVGHLLLLVVVLLSLALLGQTSVAAVKQPSGGGLWVNETTISESAVECYNPGTANWTVSCDAPFVAGVPMPSSGQLVSLAIRAEVPSGSSPQNGVGTVTVWVNGSPSILRVQIPPGTMAGTFIVTTPVAISAGDLIVVRTDGTAATSGNVRLIVTLQYSLN
jgi:hypothetical protein